MEPLNNISIKHLKAEMIQVMSQMKVSEQTAHLKERGHSVTC